MDRSPPPRHFFSALLLLHLLLSSHSLKEKTLYQGKREANPGSHSEAGARDCQDKKRKLALSSNQQLGSPDGTVSLLANRGAGILRKLGVKELINTPGLSFLSLCINNRKKSFLPLKPSSYQSELIPPQGPGLSPLPSELLTLWRASLRRTKLFCPSSRLFSFSLCCIPALRDRVLLTERKNDLPFPPS